MAAGTCAPLVEAAGQVGFRDTIALVGAVHDRFIADLRAAAALATPQP
jgi:hypothetical protein